MLGAFPPSEEVCVVPCSAVNALAWASGKLDDDDLLLAAPLVPEAIFLVNLPARAGYREMLRLVRHWRERGAVCLITRTGNDIVDRHLSEKNGCVKAFKEDTTPPKFRFLAPPAPFADWCRKWGMTSPSTPSKNAATATGEALAQRK